MPNGPSAQPRAAPGNLSRRISFYVAGSRPRLGSADVRPDPAPQSLRRHAHKDSLDTPGLSAGSTELTVLKETRVASALEMRHINHIEAGGPRAGELNGEPL